MHRLQEDFCLPGEVLMQLEISASRGGGGCELTPSAEIRLETSVSFVFTK